jgi:rubrerythrin
VRATRRELLAAAGAASLAAAPVARAADPERERAKRAVRAAVAGEQTTAVAFEAIANSDVIGEDHVEIMRVLLDHAKVHSTELENLYAKLTGEDKPLPPTRTQIRGLGHLRDERAALRLALRLEEEAIAAHLDAVRLYRNPSMLRLIAGALGTDAQHLVLLRALLGEPPVPRPFERGA